MNKEESAFKYLPYVTVSEAWSQLKVTITVWVVFSAIAMAFAAFADFGVEGTKDYWSVIPKSVWYVFGFAAFSWVVRGEEINFAFPRSRKAWLILNLSVAVVVLAATLLPSWALLPAYFGIAVFFGALDQLAAIGKKNYELLSEKPDESA